MRLVTLDREGLTRIYHERVEEFISFIEVVGRIELGFDCSSPQDFKDTYDSYLHIRYGSILSQPSNTYTELDGTLLHTTRNAKSQYITLENFIRNYQGHEK